MKQAFLIAALMLCGALCIAQRIRFTDTTNQWNVLNVSWGDFPIVYGEFVSISYRGDTAILGKRYQVLGKQYGLQTPLAIRADSLTGRIYFRFLSYRFWLVDYTDTIEHLFFDYNFQVGDTLKIDYTTNHFKHFVQSIDSIKLGSQFYKRWKMAPVQGLPYYFIEGLGTEYGPVFSVCPYLFENGYQLRCFSTGGSQPKCSPAIELPFQNGRVTIGTQIVASFDNDFSCVGEPAGIIGISTVPGILVKPNPGAGDMVINVPTSISQYALRITDAMGRIVAAVQSNQRSLPIGQYITAPGIYYYTLQDAITGQRYTGRFVFQ